MNASKIVLGFVALGGLGGLAYVASRAMTSDPSEIEKEIAKELGMPVPKTAAEIQRDKQTQAQYAMFATAESKDTLALQYEEESERSVVESLIALGRARWHEDGVHATASSTPADRRVIAEVECRRAVDDYGLSSGELSKCIEKVSTPPGIQPDGSRISLYDRMYRFEITPRHAGKIYI